MSELPKPLLNVYLGGSITGASDDMMKPWREHVKAELSRYCTFDDPTERMTHTSDKLTTQERLAIGYTIVADDYAGIENCDVAFFYLKDASRISIGSMLEMAWAGTLGKKIVLIKDKMNVHDHYLLDKDNFITFRTSSLEEAIEYIERLYVLPNVAAGMENNLDDTCLFANMLRYIQDQTCINVDLNVYQSVNIYHLMYIGIAYASKVQANVTMKEGSIHDHAMLRACSHIIS